ncbi:hypothetical protein BC938DRAFT_473814 [Jimgerdemannia flammicorona]|uniref:Uncharacterized protein n=1 Tax=Jimgerdemannia flammicorona TaxID=994334 RepID=A0A433Q3B4_9FUNG|nr:hypothetical protein BC938DRAFT_473814 [Jimgerdemannia flammicorona]
MGQLERSPDVSVMGHDSIYYIVENFLIPIELSQLFPQLTAKLHPIAQETMAQEPQEAPRFQIFLHGIDGKASTYDITRNTSADEDPDNLRAKNSYTATVFIKIFTALRRCRVVTRLDRNLSRLTAVALSTRGSFNSSVRTLVVTAITDRCKMEWHYCDIRKLGLLSDEEERYFETKISQNFLLLAEGVQQCPKCQSYCERRDKDRRATICVICTRRDQKEYMFCWFCLHPMVSYSQCTNAECLGIEPRLAILRNAPLKVGWKVLYGRSARLPSMFRNSKMVLSLLQPHRIPQRIGEVPNVPSRRACPKCGLLVEHDRACKHMKCRCDHEFCFICLKPRLAGLWQCGAFNTACQIAPVQTTIPSL